MKKILAALVLALSATGAKAEVVTYECDLHRRERGWVSDRIILSVDEENQMARAYDGYIHELDGQPKDVRFKKTRGGEYRLMWKMKIPSSSGQLIYVSYTATVNPENQRVFLIARFPQMNVTNRPTGEGPCKILTRQSLYAS